MPQAPLFALGFAAEALHPRGGAIGAHHQVLPEAPRLQRHSVANVDGHPLRSGLHPAPAVRQREDAARVWPALADVGNHARGSRPRRGFRRWVGDGIGDHSRFFNGGGAALRAGSNALLAPGVAGAAGTGGGVPLVNGPRWFAYTFFRHNILSRRRHLPSRRGFWRSGPLGGHRGFALRGRRHTELRVVASQACRVVRDGRTLGFRRSARRGKPHQGASQREAAHRQKQFDTY